MTDVKHDLYLRIMKTLDVVMLLVPFAVCWFTYYASRTASPFYRRGNWVILILFTALYVMYGKIYDGFLVSLSRISEMAYSQALAVSFTDVIMYLVIFLLTKRLPNPLPLLVAYAVQLIMATVWSYIANKWYFANFPPKMTAIIYDTRRGMERLFEEYGMEKKYNIQFAASAKECLDNLHIIDGMETVFLSGIHSHDRNIILKYCVEKNINVYVIPRVGDVIMSGAKHVHMFHLPILRVGRYKPGLFYLAVKRLMDIVISLIAVVLTSPILLITAIAIKRTDGGPVFYRQTRLTKDGKEFTVLKFRSMRVDAEKDGVARLSTGDNDDRVTKVGRIIRKVRIDELPQLFCVINGSMSLVGPRPERPEIAKVYEEEMPEFRLRLQAKAGLTGYAQVYGKYNTTPYDKLQMDLMYISNPSLAEDLRIMFATVKILFMPESTEGVGVDMMSLIKSAADYASEKSKQSSESVVACAEVVDIGEYKVRTTSTRRLLEK